MATNELNEKFSSIAGKIAAGAITVIFTVAGIMYSDAKQRITTLEERVTFLYQDKVSRAEFREEMAQLRLQSDANKTDIIARQESLKSDILARIDLIIPHLKGAKDK